MSVSRFAVNEIALMDAPYLQVLSLLDLLVQKYKY